MPQSTTVKPSMSRKSSASASKSTSTKPRSASKSTSTKSRSASSASASKSTKSRSASKSRTSASKSKSVQMQVQTQGARQLRTGRRRKGLFTQKEVREMKSYIKQSLKFIYATKERSKAFEQYLRKLTAAAKKRHPAIAKEVAKMMKQIGGGPDQVILYRKKGERNSKTQMTISQIEKKYEPKLKGFGYVITALILSILSATVYIFSAPTEQPPAVPSVVPSVVPSDFYQQNTDPPTPNNLLELIESFLAEFAKNVANRVFTPMMIQFYNTAPKLGAANRTRSTLSLSGWSERVKTFYELEEYEAEHVRGNLTEMALKLREIISEATNTTGDSLIPETTNTTDYKAYASLGVGAVSLVFLALYFIYFIYIRWTKTDKTVKKMMSDNDWFSARLDSTPLQEQGLKKFLQGQTRDPKKQK